MIRRPPRSTPLYSSAASDVYKRQDLINVVADHITCPLTISRSPSSMVGIRETSPTVNEFRHRYLQAMRTPPSFFATHTIGPAIKLFEGRIDLDAKHRSGARQGRICRRTRLSVACLRKIHASHLPDRSSNWSAISSSSWRRSCRRSDWMHAILPTCRLGDNC